MIDPVYSWVFPEGAAAFKAGLQLIDNPYRIDTQGFAHAAWRRGWFACRSQAWRYHG